MSAFRQTKAIVKTNKASSNPGLMDPNPQQLVKCSAQTVAVTLVNLIKPYFYVISEFSYYGNLSFGFYAVFTSLKKPIIPTLRHKRMWSLMQRGNNGKQRGKCCVVFFKYWKNMIKIFSEFIWKCLKFN